MKIRNTMKIEISNKELRELIKSSKAYISTRGVVFKFKNSKSTYRGRIYYNGCCVSPVGEGRFTPLVIVCVNPNNKYPININKTYQRPKWGKPNSQGIQTAVGVINVRKRYPKYTVQSHKELILSVIAHELYHLHLYRTGSKQSEIGCEKFALERLEEYRKNENTKNI